MEILGPISEDEMVACFLAGELTSARFGNGVRAALAQTGRSEALLTEPDLCDKAANRVRRGLLAVTRGYGEDRELFEHFPSRVRWIRARLTGPELAEVRYIDYSYWIEITGGTRRPLDAARRIREGVRAWEIPNDRFLEAAAALARGTRFAPLILAGTDDHALVCLEGHQRLTAYALNGFVDPVECLIATASTMARWAN
jgi:hypothetical protein